ncbi:hypothetical protein DFAR_3360013 [Desulfarculales bacterium]
MHEGVYVNLRGPSMEIPAETRMLAHPGGRRRRHVHGA